MIFFLFSSFLFILETYLLRTWWKSKEILNDNLKKRQWNSIVPRKKIKNKQRNTLLTISTHEVLICDGISLRGIKGMHTCWFVFNWSSTIPRIPKHNQLLSSFITYAIYFWTPSAFFRLTKCDPPGVSGNRVNARTWHVITRSHANGMTRLPCRCANKNNWFWKACCGYCSYLPNTVEYCFHNTLDLLFFF